MKTELLERIRDLPNSEDYIYKEKDGKCVVTNEFFIGTFAGRAFEGDTFEEAAKEMIEYLNEHIGHESMVGKIVSQSSWPNLEEVFSSLEEEEEEEEE